MRDEIAAGAECPFLGQEAWVASDGRFNPCCAPDALRRTLGDFGNVNHASLYDIWQSDAYRDLRSSYMETSSSARDATCGGPKPHEFRLAGLPEYQRTVLTMSAMEDPPMRPGSWMC